MSDPEIAKFTVNAVRRDKGGEPQVFKVKLPGKTEPAPGPQTPPGSLIEKVMDSLCLPDSTPNPGCEAGQEQHDRWMKWLENAFPDTVLAKDIEGGMGCLKGGQTTCTHTLLVAFRRFGIPNKYINATSKDGDGVNPWGGNKSKYVKVISPDNLPRKGDPNFIASPHGPNEHAHHQIFDNQASKSPPGVGGYAGGFSACGANANPNARDAGKYRPPLSELAQDPKGTMLLIGTPPDAHGIGGSQKKVWWYTDMWAFFADHSAEIKPLKEGLGG